MKNYNSAIYDFGKSNEDREKYKNEVRKILSSGSENDKKKLKELEEIWKKN